MAQILRFEKIEGFRPVWGGFKNVKFSHFGTPNGSNFAILKRLKGLGLSGGDSKTLNLATLAPQMAQILRFEKIEGFRPVWGRFKNVKFSHFGTPNGSNFAILKN